MTTALEDIRTMLLGAAPGAFLLLVNPGWGGGYLRVYHGGAVVVVQFRAGHGYGLTRVEEDDTGFEFPQEVHANLGDAAGAVVRLLAVPEHLKLQPSLSDGLRASRDAVAEVMSMLVPVRGGMDANRPLAEIARLMDQTRAETELMLADNGDALAARLAQIEAALRDEAAKFSLPVQHVREKLESTADTIKHLAGMTASAEKARLVLSGRH